MQLHLFDIPKVEPVDFIPRFVAANQLDSRNVDEVVSMLLDDAESLFGTRVDPAPYTFSGVYFGADVPQMKYRADEMTIAIRLSQCARNDNGKILWQLAHECLHLLTPVRLWTTMLEEGIACWYQMRWTKICPHLFTKNFLSPETAFGVTHRYFDAYNMVNEILKNDPDSIKRIRATQPIISKITPTQLVSEITQLDIPTAKKLSSRFTTKKH